MDNELSQLAFRVLSLVTCGVSPSRRDVIILRRKVRPDEADLPVDELCCRVICELKDDESLLKGCMSEVEVQKLKLLAGQAVYLARLRDTRQITEVEYIGRLNALRVEYGLSPIRPAVQQ